MASAACGTSRSPWTCTCGPITTPTTSAGRSPAAMGSRGSTGAPAAGSSSPAWKSTPTARCAAIALDDDWGSSFRDSGRYWLRWLHTGDGPLLWSGQESVDVLRFALAAYESSAKGGIGVDP